MKIKVRTLHDGDLILEEIEASPVKGFENIAIAKSDRHPKGWKSFDTLTGLYIGWARTKKECIDWLEVHRLKIEEARKTELYQRRVKEFEEFKKV